jgi:hypothetical protein
MVKQAGALSYFGDARRAAVGIELLERNGERLAGDPQLGATRAGEPASIVFCRHRRPAAERCWRPLRGVRSRRARVGTLSSHRTRPRSVLPVGWPNRRFVSGKPRLLGRSFLPVSLQRPRHQPVLRLGAGITATGLVDLILRAFQTLTPLLLQGGALGLQSGGNSKTEPDAAGSNACRTMDVTCSSTGAAFSDWQKGRP